MVRSPSRLTWSTEKCQSSSPHRKKPNSTISAWLAFPVSKDMIAMPMTSHLMPTIGSMASTIDRMVSKIKEILSRKHGLGYRIRDIGNGCCQTGHQIGDQVIALGGVGCHNFHGVSFEGLAVLCGSSGSGSGVEKHCQSYYATSPARSRAVSSCHR